MSTIINAKELRGSLPKLVERVRKGARAAEAWREQVEGSSRLPWEWIGATRAEKARRVFFRHRDKDYSFTDCTSLVVMQELKLRQALTTDQHFRQMGFQVLPSPPTR